MTSYQSSYRPTGRDHSPLQDTQNFRREEPSDRREPRQQSTGKENTHSQQHIRHSSTSATRVIEHTKAVTGQTAGIASIKCAENIHDQIIASYRRQLQNSANLDSMYEQLKMRIQEVQSRKTMMEDSIRYLRSDYEK